MAKSWLLLGAAALAFAVPACEDNPDGFYKKAPDGAGDRWNNGQTASVYDPNARNGFNDSYNSTSKQELCSGPVKQQRWAKMMNEKIIPPRMIAGIDLAGGDGWTGLDFRDAERKLCQSKSLSGTETTLTASWGDANEVLVTYKLATNTITDWRLQQGFRGALEFASRPEDLKDPTKPNPYGIHKYSIGVGRPIERDGRNWELNWLKTDCSADDCWDKQATEMFDALMYTYAKELASSQDSCIKAGTCRAQALSDGTAAFGVRALGVYLHIPQIALPQPAPSTPDFLYGFYVKLMPFSSSEMFVKLDDEGPVSIAPNIGDKPTLATCTQKLGMKYSDFVDNCVTVFKDPKQNDFVKGKLLGGMSHDKEAFNFSIEGVNLDFASDAVGKHGTVGDEWLPSPNDHAHELEMDIRATGKVTNEYSKPFPPGADGKCAPGSLLNTAGQCEINTFGGTGAIYREYARRVQNDIHAQLRKWLPPRPAVNAACDAGWKPDGAGSCIFEGYPIGAIECFGDKPAKGCTGFETLVTPGQHDHPDANIARVSLGPKASALGYKTVLKAGDPVVVFCQDPATNASGKDIDPDGQQAVCELDTECWSSKCAPNADPTKPKRCVSGMSKSYKACERGSLLDKSFTHVVDVLGDPHSPDKVLSLPPAVRDRKYFFKHWAAAVVKYLKAANKYPVDLGRPEYSVDACDGFSCEPEPDHLMFDQMGETGDRDKFEYIDRRFVAPGKEPMKVEYEILVMSSNQQTWKFHRRMTRAEEALYGAMSEDRSLPLASNHDNIRISNLVGSAILSGLWKGVPGEPVDPVSHLKKDAHYCASHLINGTDADPDCIAAGGDKNVPLRDSLTGLMRDDYGQPLLTNYRGIFTGTIFGIGTHYIKLVETLPYIKSAKVSVPFFKDPYSLGGTNTAAAIAETPVVLVDWRPETPADGIRIPINSMRDKFVPSATMNFSGSSLELDLDYEELADHSLRIQGVQSDNYMGNLFLCRDGDGVEAGTGDVLSIEQYESTDVIIDWLNRHPGSRERCSILTRWSASGVFPEMFACKSAGIVLNVGIGSGVGRVTSIEIYDTNLQ